MHEGEGTVVLNGRPFDIRRGMLFFFQPFQLHRVYAHVSESVPYVRSLLHFDPLLVERALQPFPRRKALYASMIRERNTANAFDLIEQVSYIEQCYTSCERSSEAEDVSLLVVQLLDVMFHTNPSRVPTVQRSGEPRQYAQAVMRWIEEHYAENISLKRIAEELHISKYYLSKVFHKETGSHLMHYVAARRMSIACMLLESTDLPIDMIASQVGISNTSYFIRLFKQHIGTTPLQYRKSVTTIDNQQ